MSTRTTHLAGTLFAAILLLAGCTAQHNGQRLTPEPANDVVTTQLVKTTSSWDGAPLPAYPQGRPEVTILRIGIPAGARLPMHHHPVINAGILTRGQLNVVTEEGRELHLEAGDPIVEVVGTLHYGYNPTSEPAEIVVFYAGQEGTPLAVKTGSQ